LPATLGWCRLKSPVEISDGWGHISKQGNVLLRFLLVEAAQVTVRSNPQWRSQFFHLAMRRGRKSAKVAMARKLAVELYWMWRRGWDYEQMQQPGSHRPINSSPLYSAALDTKSDDDLFELRRV
jgi:hypothetical protein